MTIYASADGSILQQMLTFDNKERNSASPLNFKMSLSKIDMPNVEWTVKKTSLPGCAIGVVKQPVKNVTANIPGTQIEYDPVTITFLVDEALNNYIELHSWMIQCILVGDLTTTMRDVTLHVFDGANNPIRRIIYKNAFPASLTGLPYDLDQQTVEYITADVTLQFSHIIIE